MVVGESVVLVLLMRIICDASEKFAGQLWETFVYFSLVARILGVVNEKKLCTKEQEKVIT